MPKVSTVPVSGGTLRTLRLDSGMTVPQLAKKTGRHPQSVRRLETSKDKRASLVFACQLAKALGVDVTALIAGLRADDTDDAEAEDEAA